MTFAHLYAKYQGDLDDGHSVHVDGNRERSSARGADAKLTPERELLGLWTDGHAWRDSWVTVRVSAGYGNLNSLVRDVCNATREERDSCAGFDDNGVRVPEEGLCRLG